MLSSLVYGINHLNINGRSLLEFLSVMFLSVMFEAINFKINYGHLLRTWSKSCAKQQICATICVMCKYSSKKHICLHIWTICKWPSNPWLPIIFAPRCKCCANVAFTVISTDSKSSAISVFALAQNCANVVFATHLL